MNKIIFSMAAAAFFFNISFADDGSLICCRAPDDCSETPDANSCQNDGGTLQMVVNKASEDVEDNPPVALEVEAGVGIIKNK